MIGRIYCLSGFRGVRGAEGTARTEHGEERRPEDHADVHHPRLLQRHGRGEAVADAEHVGHGAEEGPRVLRSKGKGKGKGKGKVTPSSRRPRREARGTGARDGLMDANSLGTRASQRTEHVFLQGPEEGTRSREGGGKRERERGDFERDSSLRRPGERRGGSLGPRPVSIQGFGFMV